MLSGIGAGIANPASNNACIELMPEKVATITGLRGMFRTVGGALGISLITIILHLSSNLANGFQDYLHLFRFGASICNSSRLFYARWKERSENIRITKHLLPVISFFNFWPSIQHFKLKSARGVKFQEYFPLDG